MADSASPPPIMLTKPSGSLPGGLVGSLTMLLPMPCCWVIWSVGRSIAPPWVPGAGVNSAITRLKVSDEIGKVMMTSFAELTQAARPGRIVALLTLLVSVAAPIWPMINSP